jgi:two-component system, chemotaxis family, sensor kinase CheA
MAESHMKLSEAIEQLAGLVIMADPENIMSLGSVLEQLESVGRVASDVGSHAVGKLAESLKKVVEKIVLDELSEVQEGLGLLGEGVKLIQKRLESSQTASSPQEEAFWTKWESLLGEKKPVSETANEVSAPEPVQNMDLDLHMDFISEALEHLGTIELNIINLEQSPEDKECINAIFRPFHTIKGVSGFLNLPDINRFSHAMESLLDCARNDKLPINRDMIDFILEAVDVLKNMILDLKAHIESGQISSSSRFELKPYLDKIVFLQGGGSLNPAPLAELPRTMPDEAKGPPLGEILSSRGIVSQADISEALKEQKDGKSSLRIGEILMKENKAKPKQIIDALRDQKTIPSQSTEATVKVDTAKLDNLVDLIGELVIAETLVHQNPVLSSLRDHKLTSDFSQLKRITTDLQKISMSLRMVPIRQTFQKMVRLVRDLARKSEKQVELVMSGEDTEIDRNMVESLYDPLVHMIRNAVDHGIEGPAQRKKMGKLETGQISLRAFQKGGNVVIELEDDGQGLNRVKILKKAKERGLISDDISPTDYRVDNLIFEPGFSTADQITDVSGRGVGMDVVRKAIEKLKGKVEIFSVEGKGSRFAMRVPLTLAIMDGIIVRVGESRYIIPTVYIKEMLRPRPDHVSTVQQKGELIKVRDNLLPLIRLHQILGEVPKKEHPWETLVVVVENEGSQRCLMVDDLIGKQEVVIKNLGELKEVKGVAGATIMGDGRVGLILDIHGIFEIDQTSQPSLFSCGRPS